MIEVLKQMVEALEKANRQCSYHNIAPHCAADEAIQAGKQAIVELESQEPVAWVAEDVCEGQYIDGRPRKIWWECEKGVGTAFYAHQPQRTEQEPWCMKMNGCKTKCEDCPEKVPQRTWVDLTRTQMQDVYFAVLEKHRGDHQMVGQLAFGEALQAKIKEKNSA